MRDLKNLSRLGIIALISFVILVAGLILVKGLTAAPAQAAPPGQEPSCDCSTNSLDCQDFGSQEAAQACYEQCEAEVGFDVHRLDGFDNDGLVCEQLPSDPTFVQTLPESDTPEAPADAAAPAPASQVSPPGANNLIFNGNFEFGFYQVPQLGFEPPDVGNVPINWDWYRDNKYGKYNIYNNQRLGLICRDDLSAPPSQPQDDSNFGPVPDVTYNAIKNSLALHMQSTDQNDARLGVYQTVDVVPGQDYRFSMSGTIQVQSGATTLQPDDPKAPEEAQNHTVELSFDHTGGQNWQAIPLEGRIILPWEENKLEFKVSEDDSDLATIEDFETVVTARSDKMTIFITGWRKWANWRTGIFSIDCVSLVPIDSAGRPIPSQPAPVEEASSEPAPAESDVQPAAMTEPAQEQPAAAPAEESTVIIPPSGGVLEQAGSGLLLGLLSLVLISGLVVAGVWNTRRRQK